VVEVQYTVYPETFVVLRLDKINPFV
jgi:hypothetical protein